MSGRWVFSIIWIAGVYLWFWNVFGNFYRGFIRIVVREKTVIMMKIKELQKEIIKMKNWEKVKTFRRFFKTQKGEYGHGDNFLGLDMKQQHFLAKKYYHLPLNDLVCLLKSKYHEQRMIALLIMTYKYPKTDELGKKKIFDFYLKHRQAANNWDLIDVTVPKVIGAYLINQDRKILYQFARSHNLWEKRMSILATFAFIKNNDFIDTLKIAKILLNDKHDLIHKAVGWMLREVGKKNLKVLEQFLEPIYKIMPRTMLRYAIEKFSKEKYKKYLIGEI